MTPARLEQLRGLVERGELGAGPVTAELVAELLEDRDTTARELAAVDLELLREAANVLLGLSLSSRTEGLPAREDAARVAERLRELVRAREGER